MTIRIPKWLRRKRVDEDRYEASKRISRDMDLKLCKDCKHYRHFGYYTDDKCYRGYKEIYSDIDPVDGMIYVGTEGSFLWCRAERIDLKDDKRDACGPKGKYWEAKDK